MTQLEDRLKMLILKLQDALKAEGIELPDPDKSMNDSSINLDSDTLKSNNRTSELNDQLGKLKDRIHELEETLKKLKRTRSAPSAKDGVDYMLIIEELREELESDLGNLRGRLDKVEDVQGKTEFRSKNNESRIEILENQNKDQSDKLMFITKEVKGYKHNFEEIEKKLKELRESVNEKVDTDLFEQEISYLKQLLNSLSKDNKEVDFKMPVATDPTLSTKDMQRLNDLFDKVPKLEFLITALTERVETTEDRLDGHDRDFKGMMKLLNGKADNTLKDEIEKLRSEIRDMHKQMDKFSGLHEKIEANRKRCEALERTLSSIEERMDMLKDSLSQRLRDLENLLNSLKEEFEKLDSESNRQGGIIIQINQRIDTLEIRINNMDKSLSGAYLGGHMGSEPTADVSDLKSSLDALKRDFISFKEDNYKKQKETEEELNKKVDKSDLVEFERLMRERMEAMEKSLNKAKTDLKKALRILDDRVKRLTDQVKSRGPSLDREDAMLAKKPLEGWKCATCDKNLVNMVGLPAEHYNWKRMPKKDGERIPMMGQGFSRMLMTLNHNASATNLSQRNSKTFYSPRDDDDNDNIIQESPPSSSHEKMRNSVSRLEKEGSTTIEQSMLPQIKSKKRGQK